LVHNTLRVPLLDARVRRSCRGAGPCAVRVRLVPDQLSAAASVIVSFSVGTAAVKRLPDNAFLAAVVAFEPLGGAVEALLGMIWGKLDEVLVLLLCSPLAVYSQSIRADRAPPLGAAWVLLRVVATSVPWLRAGGALLHLQGEWLEWYLGSVLAGGALVLHDAHEGEHRGAGVGVWVWHVVVAAALLTRRVVRGQQPAVAAAVEEDAETPQYKYE
jgi:hypothetical protein